MQQTITLVVITQLARKLLILSWTVFVNLPINVLDSKVFLFSTHSEVALALVSHLC